MGKRSLVQWEDPNHKPTTVPKKIQTSPASTLGFWHVESKNPLNSDDGVCNEAEGSSDMDVFFTSTGHPISICNEGLPPYSKFVIKEIRKEVGCTVLVGDELECHVSGEWNEVEYKVNSKVTVLRCMCCLEQESESDIEHIDDIFDSSSRQEERDTCVEDEKENMCSDGQAYTTSRDMGGKEKGLEPSNSYMQEQRCGSKRRIFVTDTQNYLVVEDDPMTVTAFCAALSCINKPYIASKVADIRFTYSDMRLLIGVIAHSVIEKALLCRNFSLDFLIKQAKTAISENVVLMYACNTNESITLNETLKLIKNIYSFQDYKFEIAETEKRLVSLLFNVKGNADAIGTNMVLEIKSSRSQRAEHRAQAILYSLILKEKTGGDVQPYLYYIPAKSLIEIPLKHQEIRSLLGLRNRLALACGVQECPCDGAEDCQVLSRIQRLKAGHFLRRQLEAVEREEEARNRETLLPVIFKHQKGALVSLLFEEGSLPLNDVYLSLFNKEFIRLCKGIIEEVDKNRLIVKLSEEIPLKKQQKLYISLGSSDIFFKFMRFSLIRIAYPRYLIAEVCGGFMLPEEKMGLECQSSRKVCSVSEELVFVGDNEESADGLPECFTSDEEEMDTHRQEVKPSITNKMANPTGNSERSSLLSPSEGSFISSGNSRLGNDILGSIKVSSISGVAMTPTSSLLSKYQIPIPEEYKSEFLRLNDDQRSALFLSLNCKHYRIIHGMPGTGKSTLIGLLIRILVHLKKKVLLICYTNLALSNIIKKLTNIKVYRARKEELSFRNTSEASSFFNGIELVAGTCFSFTDPVYINRKFDFCVIDEGSQLHLLLSLLPISISSRFVIVGDHLQLKPLSRSSKELGLSLFEYLLGEDHSKLRIQYRMGTEIMRLSNTLFYNNQLRSDPRPSTVQFIDTSSVDFPTFVSSLVDCTILCYFNAQVEFIRSKTSCPVETVDRFQGSEDNKVVVVFDPVSRCEVMESSERLNVALTRARKHLVLVGNKEKMMEINVLKGLIDIL